MKKLSTYLASALFMMVVLSSCSSSPEDINVADLEEPCEYVDAMEDCLDAMLEIKDGVDSPDELSESDKNRGQALAKKLEEIMNEGQEKFGRNEPDCPNNEEIQRKMRLIR